MARAEITQGNRRGILRVEHHPEGGRCLGCRGNSTAEGRGACCGCTGYNPEPQNAPAVPPPMPESHPEDVVEASPGILLAQAGAYVIPVPSRPPVSRHRATEPGECDGDATASALPPPASATDIPLAASRVIDCRRSSDSRACLPSSLLLCTRGRGAPVPSRP
jgi:hypothetical protein